jgi:hypothetical protein
MTNPRIIKRSEIKLPVEDHSSFASPPLKPVGLLDLYKAHVLIFGVLEKLKTLA